MGVSFTEKTSAGRERAGTCPNNPPRLHLQRACRLTFAAGLDACDGVIDLLLAPLGAAQPQLGPVPGGLQLAGVGALRVHGGHGVVGVCRAAVGGPRRGGGGLEDPAAGRIEAHVAHAVGAGALSGGSVGDGQPFGGAVGARQDAAEAAVVAAEKQTEGGGAEWAARLLAVLGPFLALRLQRWMRKRRQTEHEREREEKEGGGWREEGRRTCRSSTRLVGSLGSVLEAHSCCARVMAFTTALSTPALDSLRVVVRAPYLQQSTEEGGRMRLRAGEREVNGCAWKQAQRD